MKISINTVLILFILCSVVCAGDVLFREDFNDLESWKPFNFKKIKNHSSYSIISESDGGVLQAKSSASASGLVYNKTFDVYKYPNARWRWKALNIYEKGNARTKEGDDYPIRVYIIFEYDARRVGVFEKVKYKTAKLLYGQYPPDSTLNYIWANKKYDDNIITSAYTSRSKMILLEKGADNLGAWQDEDVNILEDYRKAFGQDPPRTASLAIMNDSDNTGESSVSYIDYIEVYNSGK